MTIKEKLKDLGNLWLFINARGVKGSIKTISINKFSEKVGKIDISFIDYSFQNILYDAYLSNPKLDICLAHKNDVLLEDKEAYILTPIDDGIYTIWLTNAIFYEENQKMSIKGYCQSCGNKTIKRQLFISDYDYCEYCKK